MAGCNLVVLVVLYGEVMQRRNSVGRSVPVGAGAPDGGGGCRARRRGGQLAGCCEKHHRQGLVTWLLVAAGAC